MSLGRVRRFVLKVGFRFWHGQDSCLGSGLSCDEKMGLRLSGKEEGLG